MWTTKVFLPIEGFGLQSAFLQFFCFKTTTTMASLWKHPNSRFWTACYTNKDGKQVKRSTKLTDRKKALAIAQELERVEDLVRRGTVSTLQLRKIFNDLVERTTGDNIMAPSVETYLKDWLATTVQAKNSTATAKRYAQTIDRFLKHLKDKARAPITVIASSDIDGFLSARLKEGVAPKTVIIDIKILSIQPCPNAWAIAEAKSFPELQVAVENGMRS